MELEQSTTPYSPVPDARPRVPEPPPVRLVTIADASLPAPAGAERELDEFYVSLLRFERDATGEFPAYRAENFRVVFDVIEPPIERDDLRPLAIDVPSLVDIEQKLLELEIKYSRQRSLIPGRDSLLLRDPAGNWVEITESRELR